MITFEQLEHHMHATVGLNATDIAPEQLFERCFADGINLHDECDTISGVAYHNMKEKWAEFCKTTFSKITFDI